MIITAFWAGLVGNFHCAGMCGPIAIALPTNKYSWPERLLGSLLYNLGRTITYSVLGAIFGLVGKGFVMAGFQQWLSITMGVVMILLALFPSLLHNPFGQTTGVTNLILPIKKKLSSLFSTSSYTALFSIGLLNGLLPCGLVYFAIVGAIAAGSVWEGALFMAFFGLGTLPIMFTLPLIGTLLTGKVRQYLTKTIPVMMIVVGGLFIIRGLGLKIPYLSPPTTVLNIENVQKINESKNNGEQSDKCGSCH